MHLPYSDGMFDLVLCSDLLYHRSVTDDRQALAEMHRVLSASGYLLVREASYDWLRSHHDELVWTKHRYTKKELVTKLQESGFQITLTTYVNFFLFPLAFVARMGEKMRPSRQKGDDLFATSEWLNAIFAAILKLEARLVTTISFPFGLSILCLVTKK